MNAGPFERARGVPRMRTTAMIGIGLIATPIASGKMPPIASPMSCPKRRRPWLGEQGLRSRSLGSGDQYELAAAGRAVVVARPYTTRPATVIAIAPYQGAYARIRNPFTITRIAQMYATIRPNSPPSSNE